MTGLAAQSNYLYVASTTQSKTYRYVMPNISGRVTSTPFFGYGQTRDIARTPDNTIWVASDWTSITLKAYNTSGTCIDYIEGTLVPSARGVTLDPEGYLWVSDILNDKIYKIDLTEGIENSGEEVSTNLTLSSNPFNSSVVITGEGFSGNGTIEIYDIRGHLITQDTFESSYTWNGTSSLNGTPVPCGVYFAIVIDNNGSSAAAELLRL